MKQCTKSKTGLGAPGAHPTNPGCKHRPRALRPGLPCRGRVVGRVAACGRPCRRLGWPCRKPSIGHIVALPAPCRTCLAIQPSGQAACCISTHKAAPSHNTKFCIATISLARPCARALPHAQRAGRPYHGLYRGRIAGPAAHQLDRVVAPLAVPRPASQPYVTIQLAVL